MYQIDCIELSSDEEDVSVESSNPYDTKDIFEAFLTKVSSSNITVESVNFVKRLYNNSPSDFRHSKDFYDFIASATADCSPNLTVKIVTKVCQSLCAESIPKGPGNSSLSPTKARGEVVVDHFDTEKTVSSAPPLKEVEINQECVESKSSCTHITAQSELDHGQRDLKPAKNNPPARGDVDDLRITAVVNPRAEETKSSAETGKGPKNRVNGSKPSLTEEIVQKKERRTQKRVELTRKKKIYKLQKLLEAYQKEIKDLSTAELSLAEMELEDSSYIRESKLKEKCYTIVKSLQQLQDEDYFGDLDRKRHIRVSSSNYLEINRAVEDVVNKQRRFPDVFDIRNVVRKVNLNYDLGLRPSEQHDITIDIFSEVGNRLQRRRKREFRKYTANCYEGLEDEDPAEFDVELRRKLKENRRVAKANTNQVFKKFTQIQIDQSQGLSSSDDECMQTVLTHASRITPCFRDGNAERVKKNRRGSGVRRKREEITGDEMKCKKRRQPFSTLASTNDLINETAAESLATKDNNTAPMAEVVSQNDSSNCTEECFRENISRSTDPIASNLGEAHQKDSQHKTTGRFSFCFGSPPERPDSLERADRENFLAKQTDKLENGEKASTAFCDHKKSALFQNASGQDSQAEKRLELQPIAKFLGQEINGVSKLVTKFCQEQESNDSLLVPKRSLLIQHEKEQTRSVKEKLRSLNNVVDQLRSVLKAREYGQDLKSADTTGSPIDVTVDVTQLSPSHSTSTDHCSSIQSRNARSPSYTGIFSSAAAKGTPVAFACSGVSPIKAAFIPETPHLPVETNHRSMPVSGSAYLPHGSIKGNENDDKKEPSNISSVSQVVTMRDFNPILNPAISSVRSVLKEVVRCEGANTSTISRSSSGSSPAVEPQVGFAVQPHSKSTREVSAFTPKTPEALLNPLPSRLSCPQQYVHNPAILIRPIKRQAGSSSILSPVDSSLSSTNTTIVSSEGLIRSSFQDPKTYQDKLQPLNHVTSSGENAALVSRSADANVPSGCSGTTVESSIQVSHTNFSNVAKMSSAYSVVSRHGCNVSTLRSKGNINVIDLTGGDLGESCEDELKKTLVTVGQGGKEVERSKCGKMVATPARNSIPKHHSMANVNSTPGVASNAKFSSLVGLLTTTQSTTPVSASKQSDNSRVLHMGTQLNNQKGGIDVQPTSPSVSRPRPPAGLAQSKPTPLSIRLSSSALQNMAQSFANSKAPCSSHRFSLLGKTSIEKISAAPEAPMPIIASVSSLAEVGPQLRQKSQQDPCPTQTAISGISTSVSRPTSNGSVLYRPLLTQQHCFSSVSKHVTQTQGKPELRISAVSSLQGRVREGSAKHKDWIPLENVISALAESEKKSNGNKNPQIQAVWSNKKAHVKSRAQPSTSSAPLAEGQISCRCITSTQQNQQIPRQLSLERSATELGQSRQTTVHNGIHERSSSSTRDVPGPPTRNPVNNTVSALKAALVKYQVTVSQNGRPRASCVRCGKGKVPPGGKKTGAVPPVINIDSDED